MSVRPNPALATDAPKGGPCRLQAVLAAGWAQGMANIGSPMRHQSSFEYENAPPPSLRPQASYEHPSPYGDNRSWGEWAAEKYDSSKEAVKGAGRYAQEVYYDMQSTYAARKLSREITKMREELQGIGDMESDEYKAKMAQLMEMQDRLLRLQGIAAHLDPTSVDDEGVTPRVA